MQLRSKKELIKGFLATVNTETDIDTDWKKFAEEKKEEDLTMIISQENLNNEETRDFVVQCLSDGQFRTSGTSIICRCVPRQIL